MKKIGVDLSPHQRRRLHNGHKVRVKKGEGIMMVSPGNFDTMSRTFLRGKAKEIQLSQEEILANRLTSPEAHNYTRGEVSKPPSVAPQVAPIQGNVSGGRISNAGGPRGIRVHTMGGLKKVSDHLQRLEDVIGIDVGDQLKSGLGNLLADAQTARMNELSVLKRMNMIGGSTRLGDARRSLQGGRAGQVGVSGNLLANSRVLPPALQSQPYSANWSMANQMPPQFQKFNRS
jgi:hypothetical protein